ncbi:MAG TPA: hypothetical protein DEB39_07970 [Planctomycetaceae bacterium]|nr:hypothetical protein [Planctomycetaceae bacterium]
MLILPTASSILLRAVVPGESASGCKLDVAYLEYVNGPAVEPPEIPATDSLDYYRRLETTPDRDYLRCFILSHTIKESGGKTVLALVIASDGDEGVHGKPFSATAGSKVYGLALCASQTNRRDDILFGRHYYAIDEQLDKPENGGIMLTFELLIS